MSSNFFGRKAGKEEEEEVHEDEQMATKEVLSYIQQSYK